MNEKKKNKKDNKEFLDWKENPIDTPNAKQLEVWFGDSSWGSRR